MLLNWLKRPYPFVENFLSKLTLTLGLSLIAFLFLYFFRPFNLDIVESDWYMFGFGLCSLISLGIHFLILPIFLPRLFNTESWTVGKQIVFVLSMTFWIGVINFYYNSIVGAEISPQYSLTTMVFMALAVGILPIITMTYFIEIYENNKNKSLAKGIKLPEVIKVQDFIHIVSKSNQQEHLNILSSALIYVESNKNYCSIYYLFQGNVKQYMMRITLKDLIEQIKERPKFIRCHRSFVINKEHIEKVEGNARSLLIKLKYIENQIPVSRKFDKSLLDF